MTVEHGHKDNGSARDLHDLVVQHTHSGEDSVGEKSHNLVALSRSLGVRPEPSYLRLAPLFSSRVFLWTGLVATSLLTF